MNLFETVFNGERSEKNIIYIDDFEKKVITQSVYYLDDKKLITEEIEDFPMSHHTDQNQECINKF